MIEIEAPTQPLTLAPTVDESSQSSPEHDGVRTRPARSRDSCLLCSQPGIFVHTKCIDERCDLAAFAHTYKLENELPSQIDVFRCKACDLSYQYPQVSPDLLRRWYSSSHYRFSRFIHDGSPTLPDVLQHTVSLVESHARPGARSFEIGCGDGTLIHALRSCGFSADGCDINPSAIAECHAKGIAPRELYFTEESNWNELHGVYDAIVMIDVFEHFANPVDILIAVRKLLREDGVIILEVPHVNSLFSRMLRHKWWYGFEHFCYYSETAMHRLAGASGLKVRELQTDCLNLLTLEGLARFGVFGEDAVWGRAPYRSPSNLEACLLRMFGTLAGRSVNQLLNAAGNRLLLGDQLRVVLETI